MSAQQSQSFDFTPLPCGVDAGLAEGINSLPESYLPICTDSAVIKYVRVAVHFFLPGKLVVKDLTDCNGAQTPIHYVGAGNFTEHGDGFNNNTYNGYQRAEDIIAQANSELDQNHQQWRKANDPNVQNPPANVTYPEFPPEVKVRYVLTGVYFHRDEQAYSGQTNWNVHQQYGVDPENIINIYYIPNLNASGFANALGGSMKYVFMNDYFNYIQPTCQEWSLRYSGTLLNHELGHCLGLRHTWEGLDGCDDTPNGFLFDRWNGSTCTNNVRANCWSYNPSIPTCPNSSGGKPCDEWRKISNNLMDYNQYDPHALTQCQIARMNADISGPGNKYVYSCDGCYPPQAFFAAPSVYKVCPIALPGSGGLYINAEASVNEDRWLLDICEVNPNNPDICIGNNINTTWQFGEIGVVNLSSFYTFQPNKTYRIKLTVNSTRCPLNDVYTQLITTLPCTQEDIAGDDDDEQFKLLVNNPAGETLHIYYTADTEGTLEMRIVNMISGAVSLINLPGTTSIGEFQITQDISQLQTGNYAVQAQYNGKLYTKIFLKQ